jgi:hypothetical protein
MMVVMACSAIPTAVDFFFVSYRRTDFLQNTIALRELWRERRLHLSLAGGALITVCACSVLLTFSVGGPEFPVPYVFMIATVQVSLALSTMPQQILYWSRRFRLILVTEAAFWVSMLSALGVAMLVSKSASVFVAIGVVSLMFRLAFYVFNAGRAGDGHRPAGLRRQS